jgi:hypothetical protein
VNWFPIVLVVHIVLAVSLFLPSFLLPFALRVPRHAPVSAPSEASHGRLVRGLLWLQGNGTMVIGVGVGLTGLALVAILGVQLLSQPWLLAALMLYAANLAVAFFIQRPALRRLLGLTSNASDAEQDRWRTLARRQRYVSYLMAAGIGLIAFLMNAKPGA